MARINVELDDYVNAKDGSLLIHKNGKWQLTNFEELNKNNAEKLHEVEKLKSDFDALARSNKHFVKFAKSHFMVVYNYFKIKVLSGELDVNDDELLKLDELVLNDELSVEEALKKHPFLQESFDKIYSKNEDLVEFPEV